MLLNYMPLEWLPLKSDSPVTIAKTSPPPRVTLDSPASAVMTDFTKVPAAVIEPDALADMANEYMRRRGIRALLVNDSAGMVLGIITTTDLLGEKPVQFTHNTGVMRHDIRVQDLMTPRAMLEMVEYASLRDMRVGHVAATLQKAGRRHLLVGEPGPDGECIRGLFSLTQVARQLGIDLQPDTFAKSFAEIEASLVR